MNLFELVVVIVMCVIAGVSTWSWLTVRRMIESYTAAGDAVGKGIEKICDAVEAEIPKLSDALVDAARNMNYGKEEEEEADDDEED